MTVNPSGNRDIDHQYLEFVRGNNLQGMRDSLRMGADPLVKREESVTETTVYDPGNAVLPLSGFVQQKDRWEVMVNRVTALHIASRAGHDKIVGWLLERYPELIYVKDSYESNALFWASSNCIPTLLRCNVSVIDKDVNGRTPLYSMVERHDLIGAELILEKMKETKHALIDSILDKSNIPTAVTDIITQYLGFVDKEDVGIPETFLAYVPGCKEFTEKDEDGFSRTKRKVIKKTYEFFMGYGVNLSECHTRKVAPHE